MRIFYLIMTVIGGLVPWALFAFWFQENGVSPVGFVMAIFQNFASSGFVVDLIISSVVFLVWSYINAKEHRIKGWIWVLIANLAAGLSMALPLYLFLRETRLNSQSAKVVVA